MNLVFIIDFVLIAIAIIAFIWMIIGIPSGIVWFIIYLQKRATGYILNKKKWFFTTFGGIIVLLFVFLCYASIFIFRSIYGFGLMVE